MYRLIPSLQPIPFGYYQHRSMTSCQGVAYVLDIPACVRVSYIAAVDLTFTTSRKVSDAYYGF